MTCSIKTQMDLVRDALENDPNGLVYRCFSGTAPWLPINWDDMCGENGVSTIRDIINKVRYAVDNTFTTHCLLEDPAYPDPTCPSGVYVDCIPTITGWCRYSGYGTLDENLTRLIDWITHITCDCYNTNQAAYGTCYGIFNTSPKPWNMAPSNSLVVSTCGEVTLTWRDCADAYEICWVIVSKGTVLSTLRYPEYLCSVGYLTCADIIATPNPTGFSGVSVLASGSSGEIATNSYTIPRSAIAPFLTSEGMLFWQLKAKCDESWGNPGGFSTTNVNSLFANFIVSKLTDPSNYEVHITNYVECWPCDSYVNVWYSVGACVDLVDICIWTKDGDESGAWNWVASVDTTINKSGWVPIHAPTSACLYDPNYGKLKITDRTGGAGGSDCTPGIGMDSEEMAGNWPPGGGSSPTDYFTISASGCDSLPDACTPATSVTLASWTTQNGAPTVDFTNFGGVDFTANGVGITYPPANGVLYLRWRVIETGYNIVYLSGSIQQTTVGGTGIGKLNGLPDTWPPPNFSYPGYMELQILCY